MFSTIQQANIDPSKYYVICLPARWGAMSYMTAVEYKLFNPKDQALNNNFNLYTAEHVGFKYSVIEMPKEYEDRVKAIAVKMGLKVNDGIPLATKNGVETRFPIQGSNIGTLSNKSRPNSHMEPYMTEDEECEKICRGGSPIPFE